MDRLAGLLSGRARLDDHLLVVHDMPPEAIGELAAAHGIVLHELTSVEPTLEDAFMDLTEDSVEFVPTVVTVGGRGDAS
jgi:ABC-2 type transport system ATP-binding protein